MFNNIVRESTNDAQKRYIVKCLDDVEVDHVYLATTPYNALCKARYTLDLSNTDPSANILMTSSCLHLYMEHGGKTYAVRNQLPTP